MRFPARLERKKTPAVLVPAADAEYRVPTERKAARGRGREGYRERGTEESATEGSGCWGRKAISKIRCAGWDREILGKGAASKPQAHGILVASQETSAADKVNLKKFPKKKRRISKEGVEGGPFDSMKRNEAYNAGANRRKCCRGEGSKKVGGKLHPEGYRSRGGLRPTNHWGSGRSVGSSSRQ